MNNAYPNKPVLQYSASNIGMQPIINAIKASGLPTEVQRAVYILTRNETGNGHTVVNGTNVGGVQSDGGAWPEKWNDSIVGTCIMTESRTGKERGFVVFDTLESGVKFMCERLRARGLYIGGYAAKIAKMQINSPNDLASAYYKEWVEGETTYHIKDDELSEFVSMYNQSVNLFNV